jgi:hypothetical protein
VDPNFSHLSSTQDCNTQFRVHLERWKSGGPSPYDRLAYQMLTRQLPRVQRIVFLGMGSLHDRTDWDRSHRQTFAAATFARNFMLAASPQRQIRTCFIDFNYTEMDNILIKTMFAETPEELIPIVHQPSVSRGIQLSTYLRSESTFIVMFTPKAPWREALADCLTNTNNATLPSAMICRAWDKNHDTDQVSDIHKQRWDALGYCRSWNPIDNDSGLFENIHLYKRPSSAVTPA